MKDAVELADMWEITHVVGVIRQVAERVCHHMNPDGNNCGSSHALRNVWNAWNVGKKKNHFGLFWKMNVSKIKNDTRAIHEPFVWPTLSTDPGMPHV
jgi:hypothetical protein